MFDLQTPESMDTETLQRNFNALKQLVEISHALNSTVTIQPLLQLIMDSASHITDAEAASILLVDKNTNELFFAASTGSDADELRGIVVPIEGSIAGSIVKEDKAIIIDDTTIDPRHYSTVDKKIDLKTRSILGVPMRIKDRLVGVIEVLNKREGKFNDEDLRHIAIIASQASVAIDNSQLVSALTKANDELSQLDKLKTDFIAIASHELRTPLSVILGYASFLHEEAEGEASDHAQMVLQSALHLRNLIEDMTNLRFVQSQSTDLDIADVPLSDILTQAYADAQSVAEAKEQTLTVHMPDPSLMVRADKLKTEMALTNTLNNAVKFTPTRGQIMVTVQTRPQEAWIKIQDTGFGLAQDQLDRIFDQFYQVEDHLTRKVGGMGLGLSIARGVLEAQGGRIWAESSGPEQGSVFFIALPLAS